MQVGEKEQKKGNNGKLNYKPWVIPFCVCVRVCVRVCACACVCVHESVFLLVILFFLSTFYVYLLCHKRILYILRCHCCYSSLLVELYISTGIQMFCTYRLSAYFSVYYVLLDYMILMHCSSHCHFKLRLVFIFLMKGVSIPSESSVKDCNSNAVS